MYFPSTLLTEALDGGLTVEPEMRPVVIVAVQELGEFFEALGVFVVGADVGPLAQQDADEGLGLAVGLRPAGIEALAATWRDPAQLLDVQMHQVARTIVDVADGLAGGAVQAGEPVEAQASQHSVDGGTRDLQLPGDAVGAPALPAAQAGDGIHQTGSQRTGPAMRGTGPVHKPLRAFSPPAPPPLVGRGPTDALRGRRLGHAPAIHRYPLDQQKATGDGQSCITMRHEGRSSSWGSLHRTSVERNDLHFVNNLSGNYS